MSCSNVAHAHPGDDVEHEHEHEPEHGPEYEPEPEYENDNIDNPEYPEAGMPDNAFGPVV